MLKGHTFNLQTFTSELSNTNNSVTIAEGYFVIKGRLLQIISSETISNISNNGYYSLVCEIDLSKTNTTSVLNQAEIKNLYNASAYPTLTQQDITGSGTVFQYEFARFKVESGTITNFTDRRGSVVDNTYKLKGDFKVLNGTMTNDGTSTINGSVSYPEGFTKDNCVVVSSMFQNVDTSQGKWSTGNTFDATGIVSGSLPCRITLSDSTINISAKNIYIMDGHSPTLANITQDINFKIVLMKIS